MGDFRAGKLIISLVVYFTLLLSIFFVVEWFAVTYDLDTTYSTNGNLSELSAGFTRCIEPRGFVNPSSNEFEEVPFTASQSVDCKYMQNSYDEVACDAIAGCTYDNDTFLWWTTGASCDGIVNTSFYGISGDVSSIWKDIDTEIFPQLTNRTTCELFGYQWSDSDIAETIGFGTLIEIIADFTTLQLTLTDNTVVNTMLQILLFYLPLIALIIAIYFAIPFIH